MGAARGSGSHLLPLAVVVLEDDRDFVPADDAISRVLEYLQDMRKLWQLAKRYWFDALLVAGIGVSIAAAVTEQGKKDGPQGPLWFDVLASIAFLAPLFF